MEGKRNHQIIHSSDLFLTLVGNSSGTSSGSFWVQVVRWLRWLQVFVQFEDQWNTSWDVQLSNVSIRDTFQVLNQTSQGVTVSGDHDGLTTQQVLGNDILPVWQQSVNDQSQRFSFWQDIWVNVLVSFITLLREWRRSVDWWRWNIEGSSVGVEFFLTELLQSFSLVLTL